MLVVKILNYFIAQLLPPALLMIFRSQDPQFVTSGKATRQSNAALLYQPFFLAPQCRKQHI